jgi:uncharacterized membrane protein YhaH (DUF805 family)
MNPFWWLFGVRGRIGPVAFVIGAALIVGLFLAAIEYSSAALPQMAEVLAPQGINAAFALNAIWVASGLIAIWAIIALTAKRLRDREHWPWWGALALVPLVGEALINDAVFLISRLVTVPRPLQYAIISACGIIAVCVVVECLLPGRRSESDPRRHG